MQTAEALAWWVHHPTSPEWMARYIDTEDRPDRASVVRALGTLAPFGSLFEVGCHCGPLLSVIQKAYPDAVLAGCDVNRHAVDLAKRWLPSVIEGAFPAVTADWPDRSVDVVLSSYALAYLSPDDIWPALKEAARIARKGVVLCEPMAWCVDEVGVLESDGGFVEWRHPYLPILHRIAEYAGWTAHCQELNYDDNRLSGLMVMVRP